MTVNVASRMSTPELSDFRKAFKGDNGTFLLGLDFIGYGYSWNPTNIWLELSFLVLSMNK